MIINNKIISESSKPYTIAEVGINHNGKIANAIKMIDVAKKAGVDCIKFQTFKASEIIIDKKVNYTYTTNDKEVTESMYEMFKRYELKKSDWIKIRDYCEKLNIDFLSTPQNKDDMDLLAGLGIKSIKIGSDDFNNYPLINYYCTFNIPIIMSIGMANEKEIDELISFFNKIKFKKYTFLLCTSSYPTPYDQVNLNKIKSLKIKLKNKVVGFSDHTENDFSSMIAVGLGARIFEKHFTLNKKDLGPDHKFSLDPVELKNWVDSIHTAYKLLGSHQLIPTENELEMRKIARRTVTAIKNISRGDVFSINNIGLRRPNVGLEPIHYKKIIGKISLRDIPLGGKIKKNDF